MPPDDRDREVELGKQVVTVTITDAGGNVRAVRDAEFLVRPHSHHERDEDDE